MWQPRVQRRVSNQARGTHNRSSSERVKADLVGTDAQDEEQDAEDAEDRREGEGQRRHHVAQRPDLDAGRAVGTPAADAFIANPDRRLLRDARPRWALPAQT